MMRHTENVEAQDDCYRCRLCCALCGPVNVRGEVMYGCPEHDTDIGDIRIGEIYHGECRVVNVLAYSDSGVWVRLYGGAEIKILRPFFDVMYRRIFA